MTTEKESQMKHSKDEVINALERCLSIQKRNTPWVYLDVCSECPLRERDKDTCYNLAPLFEDVIYLLKTDEPPVTPVLDFDGRDVWRCGNCGATIFHPEHTQADEDERNYNQFCRRCGRSVKWNAR